MPHPTSNCVEDDTETDLSRIRESATLGGRAEPNTGRPSRKGEKPPEGVLGRSAHTTDALVPRLLGTLNLSLSRQKLRHSRSGVAGRGIHEH